MRTVQHTYVGYKLIAITFTLLSHDNQIYMAPCDKNKLSYTYYDPYMAILHNDR